VNWPNVCVPKDLGGLGVPHPERFGRALCLRWLWHERGDDPKPWVGTEVPCKDMVRLLFNAFTTVTNWQWQQSMLQAPQLARQEAPRYLVPHIFILVCRKNRSDR
jgi:hypothetical protein